jgi:cobyrinic acid a,c-diamide synthase
MTVQHSRNSRLFISAPKKSSGKTTLTLGISAALVKQNHTVKVFKKGADYIDPMWHRAATGQNCYNLDLHLMTEKGCLDSFNQRSLNIDFSIIEGNHGLHDGFGLRGEESSAHLAKLLKAPVLLVVDASGSNRGVAAVVLGHQKLDPDVNIAGVILNQVANNRQIKKQRESIEYHCGIPVIGAMPKFTEFKIKERHLGLLTVHESDMVDEVIDAASASVSQYCNLDQIKQLSATNTIEFDPSLVLNLKPEKVVDIAVAYDKAFCFYYPENIEALEQAGANLKFFDTMNDQKLPEADGIYIGGGFPESFLKELEANQCMRDQLKKEIEAGTPVYAECGGLMYLTQSIKYESVQAYMVGAISADVQFHKKPVGHGYSNLKTIDGSWLNIEHEIQGHEFHYSELTNLSKNMDFAFQIKRGCGVDKKYDGIKVNNLIAAYTHLHAISVPEWAVQFVEFIKHHKTI